MLIRYKFIGSMADVKGTWRVINSLLKPQPIRQIPLEIKIDDRRESDPERVAEAIINYFDTAALSLANSIRYVAVNPMSYLSRIYDSFM